MLYEYANTKVTMNDESSSSHDFAQTSLSFSLLNKANKRFLKFYIQFLFNSRLG